MSAYVTIKENLHEALMNNEKFTMIGLTQHCFKDADVYGKDRPFHQYVGRMLKLLTRAGYLHFAGTNSQRRKVYVKTAAFRTIMWNIDTSSPTPKPNLLYNKELNELIFALRRFTSQTDRHLKLINDALDNIQR